MTAIETVNGVLQSNSGVSHWARNLNLQCTTVVGLNPDRGAGY
jgi:hypothetical protein